MQSANQPAPSTHTPSSPQAGSRPRRPNPASNSAAWNSFTRTCWNLVSLGLTTGRQHSPDNGGRVSQLGAQTNNQGALLESKLEIARHTSSAPSLGITRTCLTETMQSGLAAKTMTGKWSKSKPRLMKISPNYPWNFHNRL